VHPMPFLPVVASGGSWAAACVGLQQWAQVMWTNAVACQLHIRGQCGQQYHLQRLLPAATPLLNVSC
jgi:hypothetical protein